MNSIYDNGALMIGNIKEIIKYMENDETLENWEFEYLLNDLKALKDEVEIVMINYENPMGYSIDYWYKDDKMEVD